MFRGSIVALVTPMLADGAVDFPALRRLVDWHIAEGTQALVAVGTTGESAAMDDAEHVAVVAAVAEQAAGRVPVIAGTGAASTAKAVKLTSLVSGLGIAGTLCVTPYYVRPTQEGLYAHFSAVAEAAAQPVLLYNVPGRTGCDLLPETAARLSRLPRIVGIKEATGKVERVADLRARCRDGFLLLSGDDATACNFMLAGGDGVISVTSNVAPKLMTQMCAAALAGDTAAAKGFDEKLQGLHETLFVEPNPIPAKWALARLHQFANVLRLPMTPLTPASEAAVRAAAARAGVHV